MVWLRSTTAAEHLPPTHGTDHRRAEPQRNRHQLVFQVQEQNLACRRRLGISAQEHPPATAVTAISGKTSTHPNIAGVERSTHSLLTTDRPDARSGWVCRTSRGSSWRTQHQQHHRTSGGGLRRSLRCRTRQRLDYQLARSGRNNPALSLNTTDPPRQR